MLETFSKSKKLSEQHSYPWQKIIGEKLNGVGGVQRDGELNIDNIVVSIEFSPLVQLNWPITGTNYTMEITDKRTQLLVTTYNLLLT